MREFFHRAVRAFALAMFAALAFSSTAHAAAYVSKWDPPYGDPFNGLGWRGQMEIDAPTNCGAADGATGTFACASGAATISYAFVELYDLDTNEVLDTLTFAPPAPSSFVVTALEFASGALTGAITGRSAFIYDAVFDVDFALQFAVDGVLAKPLPDHIAPPPANYTGPILIFRDRICIEEHHKNHDYDHDEDCDDYKFAYGTNNLIDAENRPVVTWTLVSEPATLALVLAGALFAGGMRRKAAGLAA